MLQTFKSQLSICYLILGFAGLSAVSLQAQVVSGVVKDAQTGELLVGAFVTIQAEQNAAAPKFSGVSGLDGSYSIQVKSTGNYVLKTGFIGYKNFTKNFTITANTPKTTIDIALVVDNLTLNEVVVMDDNRGTDYQARELEKRSATVVNIISAKQIELSPDISVANVIQRVSGLSIERNASGDPQYAIVRGMDKRYNNTLVNGIKIPSPDNENRYVPLDIFPAVFLERLEVFKSLTANMEADAIGGTVNMVMRSAPSKKLINADVQLGYNSMHFQRPFGTYDRSNVRRQSPKERFGDDYMAVPGDFPTENMTLQQVQALPDVLANISLGNRYKSGKLGVMVGASFQNSYRPVSNYFYDPAVNGMPGNPQIMRQLIERETSSQMQRIAFHGKVDYKYNPRNTLSLYIGQYNLNEFRVRDQLRRESFVAADNFAVYPITRFSNIYQSITTADFRGEHHLSDALKIDWSAVYSLASNERPDDGVFSRAGQFVVATGEVTNEIVYFQGTRNARVWERNQDGDLSGYFNLSYKPEVFHQKVTLQTGGVVRNKLRSNYFNYYNYAQIFGQFRGVDWNEFGEVRFTAMANPFGSGDRSNMVYDAYENIFAGYINTIWDYDFLKIHAGLRAEQTNQGYEINETAASGSDVALTNQQSYLTLFPSLSVKQRITKKSNLKGTYFKGISRPGFYEIVPTIRNAGGGDGFYSERGNENLRPSIGHSVDLRFEHFPNGVDQILVGVFYKLIEDPIEYGFPQVTPGQQAITSRILPQNFANATNVGLELDYTRYFKYFGVRMNYTFTNSEITTNKIVLNQDGTESIENQTRGLQGQSNHIANFSLLYKNQKYGIDGQIVMNYTGERLAFVSPYLDADHYMLPMTQLDLSIEKTFGSGWVVMMRVNNILNTPYQLYVKKPLAVPTDPYPYQTDPYNIGFVRRDLYGIGFRLGVRYNFEYKKS